MTSGDNRSHQIICKFTINMTTSLISLLSLFPSFPQILPTESLNKVDGP